MVTNSADKSTLVESNWNSVSVKLRLNRLEDVISQNCHAKDTRLVTKEEKDGGTTKCTSLYDKNIKEALNPGLIELVLICMNNSDWFFFDIGCMKLFRPTRLIG